MQMEVGDSICKVNFYLNDDAVLSALLRIETWNYLSASNVDSLSTSRTRDASAAKYFRLFAFWVVMPGQKLPRADKKKMAARLFVGCSNWWGIADGIDRAD